MNNTNQDLVSIVTPVYNAEQFLDDTIRTVKNQTYQNWELLLVDDCSLDKSVEVINKYQEQDDRIKLFANTINSGAALSRNRGIDEASGNYIAFLDADDLWAPTKLEKQLAFMIGKNCAFSFTGYEFANAEGKPNGKKVYIPDTITYKQALKNTTISTITVMFDMQKLSKTNIYMPNITIGEDSVTWWNILKTINYAYGLNEILSYYRRTKGTLSSNKITSAKKRWMLYRGNEKFNIFISAYNFCFYVFYAVKRRV